MSEPIGYVEPDENESSLCHEESDLEYQGEIGAPGYGQAWECRVCKKGWTKIGENFFDPSEYVHELTIWDVR